MLDEDHNMKDIREEKIREICSVTRRTCRPLLADQYVSLLT